MPKRYKSNLDACKPAQLLSLLQLVPGGDGGAAATKAGTAGSPQLGEKLRELSARNGHEGQDLLARAADPDSSVKQLRKVMLAAQALSAEAEDEEQWYAASFLYHLTVAAALGRHNVNLSARTPDSRIGLYEDFAASLLEDPLGEIFRKAADLLRSGS